VVDGQKVPIRWTRLHPVDKRKQRLGSYELFQRSGPMQSSVWDKIMRGLSTRNYGAVVKDLHDAYGIERAAVSENFIEASREKVKELMERPLGELRLCAVLIDGLRSRTGQMIVALGIGCDGRKTVLGLREGATENAAVVNGLLSELGTLNAGGLAIRSSAGWAQGCLSPSVNSEKLSAIARFRCCCLRWPVPFPRNQLRKESLSRKLYWLELDLTDMTANVRSVLTHV